MKRHLVLLTFVLSFYLLAVHEATDATPAPRVLSLCELVDQLEGSQSAGDTSAGHLFCGGEQAVLYDPTCREGKDLTYVEFRSHTRGATKKLDQLVAKDKRASVVLEGVFYGPELNQNVDPKLPAAIKERLENSPRRYGHMDSMETMISVTRVVEATEVGVEVPPEKTKPAPTTH